MPAARKELLDSARSYARSGENRLTELFATVLATHGELVGSLFERIGLPVGDRVEVRTQEQVAPGCIVDLVVRTRRANGALVSQLWSEHKTVSGFRHEQREDYQRALEASPGEGGLLTITVDNADDGAGAWHRLTWQQVGELIDGVGRVTADGRPWRQAALAPDAPARDRLLHELLWYLEQEGFAVSRPLLASDVDVFKGVVDTYTVLDTLLGRAADHMGDHVKGSDGADEASFWFHVTPPAGSWLQRLEPFETYCEVLVCVDDAWWPQGTGDPAIGAGYTIDPRLHDTLAANADWVDELEEAGYAFGDWAGYVRCWRTRPLRDLADAGTSLDAQARELASWARGSIDALTALDPGECVLPSPRKGGRRRKPSDDGDAA
jgi:hypothetical protein